MVKENLFEIPKTEKIEAINDKKLCEDMDLIFILDRSGSMYGSEQDTIKWIQLIYRKTKNQTPKQQNNSYPI